MASFSAPATVLFVAVVALLASSAAARPGAPFHPRNILFIAYSVSTTGSSSTAADVSAAPHRFYRFVSIYRTITPFSSSSSSAYALNDGRPFLIRRSHLVRRAVAEPASLGFGSLQERAKDIIVVVAGLLFGVGCGALTAATMYLVWSLLSSHYDACGSDGEEEEDYLADSPKKKVGYVQIPAADSTPAKEGYEAN